MTRTAVYLARLRLVAQRIIGSELTDAASVVRSMMAMQGQDLAGAKWSIGLRAQGVTKADVDAALDDGRIVRSWPLRGTLHLTAGEDLPWMLDLCAPQVLASTSARQSELALDERTFERARAVVMRQLAGGRILTRDEVLGVLERARVGTDGQRGYHILAYLSRTGTLCCGPSRGKDQTFVLLADWVKAPRRLDRDEALAELARRYFVSHGPATIADFLHWTKLPAAAARSGLAAARGALAEMSQDGVTYWLAKDTEDRLSDLRRAIGTSVVALPGFDEFVLGYRDRSAMLDPAFAARICRGGNGVFAPTVVRGGAIIGTWRRAPTKRRGLELATDPFRKWPAGAAAGFTRAGDAYRRFLADPPAT